MNNREKITAKNWLVAIKLYIFIKNACKIKIQKFKKL